MKEQITEKNSDLNTKVIWDYESALKRIMGNSGLIPQLVDMFAEDTLLKLNQIGQAINAGDFDVVRKLSHSIKGSAANLSAVKLQSKALLLEVSTKHKDSGMIAQIYKELLISYQETVTCFEQYKATRK